MEIKECCKNSENLKIQKSDKPELVIRKCCVCGCRHFELTVDAGKFGLTMSKEG